MQLGRRVGSEAAPPRWVRRGRYPELPPIEGRCFLSDQTPSNQSGTSHQL